MKDWLLCCTSCENSTRFPSTSTKCHEIFWVTLSFSSIYKRQTEASWWNRVNDIDDIEKCKFDAGWSLRWAIAANVLEWTNLGFQQNYQLHLPCLQVDLVRAWFVDWTLLTWPFCSNFLITFPNAAWKLNLRLPAHKTTKINKI